ncbi:alpha/beta hydrolase fold protein [Rippkaea orientalis PCC 8801]|uniref:Alpha/beta hydrolase fold protein n=1 Tax=Rippkaea orientalis (strain PCC 8801 / RF-1) TaxID=41431 RepID=B7JZ35_RIPO1|nr:alpha/beta hydrolase [Rippkaea orientalis]ACK66112.1 alpha/beta hydrolase fold protein [Rippkaea orientalis PCC 8801]
MRLLTPQPRLSLTSNIPLLVYLPGMDGTGELFHRQAKELEQFFQIYCLSIPQNDCSDWNTLAKKTITLIEKERQNHLLSSPVYLCGESFGGCLALKVALMFPSLIDRMILINPASSFCQYPWLSWGVQLTQWIPEFLHRTSTVGFLPFLGSLNRMERKDYQALLKAMQSVPQSVVSWRLSLLRDFDVTETELSQLYQPILTLVSDSDRLLPSVAEGKRLVRYFPNSNLAILPDSGHACLLEKQVNLAEIFQKYQFLPSG